METGKEMGGEKREEVRIKETKSPKAIDNTYGVRVRGRHKHRRGDCSEWSHPQRAAVYGQAAIKFPQ